MKPEFFNGIKMGIFMTYDKKNYECFVHKKYSKNPKTKQLIQIESKKRIQELKK